MELAHGAWSFGVNATEDELETANAVMDELERIGAHSADVVARWMHVHGSVMSACTADRSGRSSSSTPSSAAAANSAASCGTNARSRPPNAAGLPRGQGRAAAHPG